MIRWQASAQLSYSGAEFADLFRHTSEWSVVSHIVVDVTSAVESVDDAPGGLQYTLDVELEPKTGGRRELATLATFLGARLGATWTIGVEAHRLRCRFDSARRAAPPLQ